MGVDGWSRCSFSSVFIAQSVDLLKPTRHVVDDEGFDQDALAMPSDADAIAVRRRSPGRCRAHRPRRLSLA
jgi:hypothetical protein